MLNPLQTPSVTEYRGTVWITGQMTCGHCSRWIWSLSNRLHCESIWLADLFKPHTPTEEPPQLQPQHGALAAISLLTKTNLLNTQIGIQGQIHQQCQQNEGML